MLTISVTFGLISWYVNREIESYNMDYYLGKDNGAFFQLKSICLFGILFFLLFSKRKKLLNALLGLGLSIITAISIYILIGSGLLFPVLSSLVLMLLFLAIEYFVKVKQTPAANSSL